MLADSAIAAEAVHVQRHWGEFLTTLVFSAGGWSAVAYGVDTFPNPTNKYALWAVNLIRAILNKKVSAGSALDLAGRVADASQAAVTIKATPEASAPSSISIKAESPKESGS